MAIDLLLEIRERRDDRVFVAVTLRPDGGPERVDGAALELLDPAGAELCPRTLLPLSGELRTPLTLTVELRAIGALPDGARVHALAWCGHDQAAVECPADPDVSLAEFVAGLPDRAARLGEGLDVYPLDDEARAPLLAAWPWLVRPLRAPDVTAVLEAADRSDREVLREDLGLDDASAEWLEELLSEPD